jgi:ABC-type branched-subunit amino acid transport system permease subunit
MTQTIVDTMTRNELAFWLSMTVGGVVGLFFGFIIGFLMLKSMAEELRMPPRGNRGSKG